MMRTFIRTLFVALVLLGMPNESYSQSLLKQLGQAAKEFKEGVQEGLGVTSKSKKTSKKEKEESTLESVSSDGKQSEVKTAESAQQSSDLVTLVVSGDGVTKDEAIKVALRSAIEQAYGAFVSANTEILNDELVKDEIVTVASGNIHGYKELGAVTLPNGNQSVTLRATVSTSKLVAYAQNKGAETEFAGATFGANLRLYEMNRKAEEKVLENLYSQLEMLAPYVYDFEIEVGDPVLDSRNPEYTNVPIAVIYKANENTKAFGDLIYNTINGLGVDENLAESMKNQGFKFVNICIWNIPRIQKNGFNTYPSNSNLRPDYFSDFKETYHYVELDATRLKNIFISAIFSFNITDNLGGTFRFKNIRRTLVGPGPFSFYAFAKKGQIDINHWGPAFYFRRISPYADTRAIALDYNYSLGEIISGSSLRVGQVMNGSFFFQDREGRNMWDFKVLTSDVQRISKISIERQIYSIDSPHIYNTKSSGLETEYIPATE